MSEQDLLEIIKQLRAENERILAWAAQMDKENDELREKVVELEAETQRLRTACNKYSEQETLGGTVLPCIWDYANGCDKEGNHSEHCPAAYRHLVGAALQQALKVTK